MAAKKILILAGDYSEDYEVMCPYVTLRSVGHDVHVASPNKNAGDTIRTSIHEFEFDDEDNYSEKPGHRFTLNTTFADINVDDYDGLFCPGGRGAEYIRTDDRVKAIVRHFAESGKPMASVCNGLQVFTEAGVVDASDTPITRPMPFAPVPSGQTSRWCVVPPLTRPTSTGTWSRGPCMDACLRFLGASLGCLAPRSSSS